MFDPTRAPSEIPPGLKDRWEAIYRRLLGRPGAVACRALRDEATRRLCDEVNGRRAADPQMRMFGENVGEGDAYGKTRQE
jgi:hypothetical protein